MNLAKNICDIAVKILSLQIVGSIIVALYFIIKNNPSFFLRFRICKNCKKKNKFGIKKDSNNMAL